MALDFNTPLFKAGSVLRSVVVLRAHGVKHGRTPCFRRRIPQIANDGTIVVGDRLYAHQVRFPTRMVAHHGAEIVIGDHVRFYDGVLIDAHARVEIGDHTRLGELNTIIDSNHHPISEGDEVRVKPIRIGRNVFSGRLCTFLPGADVGDHCVVQAGSVVSGVIPPRTVIGGNPAVVRRELQASDGWFRP